MSLADLLGDPVCCVRCAINGEPAAAVPGSDLCADHEADRLFQYAVDLSRQAVARA